MKLNKKFQNILLLILAINILCAAGFFLGAQKENEHNEKIKYFHTRLSNIERVKDELEEHFNYLQAKVLQASLQRSDLLLGRQDIEPRQIEKDIQLDAVNKSSFSPEMLKHAEAEREKIRNLADQLIIIKRDLFKAMGDTLILDAKAFDKVHSIFVNRLIPNRSEILVKLNSLHKIIATELDLSYQASSLGSSMQTTFILIDVILTLALIFMAISAAKDAITKPIEGLLSNLGKKHPLPIEENEFGLVASHVNKIQTELIETQKVIGSFAQGGFEKPIEATHLSDNLLMQLASIRRRFQQLNEEGVIKDAELKTSQQKIKSLEKNVDEIALFHQNRFINFLDGLLTCEVGLMGQVLGANDSFLKLLDIPKNKIKELKYEQLFASVPESKITGETAWKTISKGATWNGVIAVEHNSKSCWMSIIATPLRNLNNEIEKYLISGFDISEIKAHTHNLSLENEKYAKALNQTEKSIEELNKQLAAATAEHEVLRKSYQEQRELQNRLVTQQDALLQLTKNSDFKEGNIRGALRLVTETAVSVLGEERASLWLFTNKKSKLHCLDIYVKQTNTHHNSIEFSINDIPELFDALSSDNILTVIDVKNDLISNKFDELYLSKSQVNAYISVPIHLGGSVVGALMVEHVGQNRKWDYDEQIFLISTAELVSLTLEQGNRKAMEEELKGTLEESQALDEELRQNAEEIEATNEEMRRTQIELRGQISALNNAAVVSESNLDGLITYANNEFLNIYKYTKQQVLGKNHDILRSDEHSNEFYQNLWQVISGGNVWHGEIKNRASDGSFIWVSITITPVLGLDGQPFKYIAVSFNITRQKLQSQRIKEALQVALEQEEALRNSASNLIAANDEMRKTQLELDGQIHALNNSSLVLETDLAGNILKVNRFFLQLIGLEQTEILKMNFIQLKSESQNEAVYSDIWRAVSGGNTWRGELELATTEKNNNIFTLITSNPLMDENGDPSRVIHVLFDISEQKKQEFRLKSQQAALVEINSTPAVKEGNIKKAFQHIAKVGYETMNVSRVSIWIFIENGRKVRCSSVFQKDSHEHTEGTILETEMYPNYFRFLERDRIIDAFDANNDPRTKELSFSLFKPLGIMSVLDVIIRSGDRTVGILSFENHSDLRHWTLDELSFASSLADVISLVMEQKERQLNSKLKQTYLQLEEVNKEMIRQKQELEETTQGLAQSIKYAKRIQTNILPSKDYLDKHIGKDSYFFVHRQRDSVGGDFYWFDQLGDEQVFVIGDGTGHGVPGAFLTLIGYLLLNQIVIEKRVTTPGEILYHLHIGVRQALKQDDEEAGRQTSRDGMDVAVCTFNVSTQTVQYSGANLPLYYYKDWEVNEVKPTKKSIGGEQLEEERIFANHSIQLKTGDAFYMYTDGFVDQFGGPEEKRFSTKRFKDLILRTQNESMSTQRAMLNMEWKDWKEDREQLDDVTVFGFRVS